MWNAAITGWGSYLPSQILTNQDLERRVETSDAWIQSRTGIRERRQAGPAESTSTMGLEAGRRALVQADLSPGDVDLVLCSTTTPDHLLPATACLIQERLGASRAAAFDVNAACTGFMAGLSIASQFIQSGTYRRVLVIASETLTRFVNYADRNTCILFGDGAAAMVLEATGQRAGVLSTVLGSKGDVDRLLVIEAGGSARPASSRTVADDAHTIRMRGSEVFKLAVRNMAAASVQALLQSGLTADKLDAVIPHQANLRIVRATQEALGLPGEKVFINLDRLGNTGAASIPLALAEFLDTRPVHVGNHFLLTAFGGGLTWGASVLRWADVAALKKERLLKKSA